MDAYGKLRISASVYHRVGDVNHRKSLTLNIDEFKGPGKYEITSMSSNLTGVKLDLSGVEKAAEKNDKAETDKATQKAAIDSIGGASVTLLRGAKVEVTQVSDAFIDGTVTWSGHPGLRGTNKVTGEFHAKVREKKKK